MTLSVGVMAKRHSFSNTACAHSTHCEHEPGRQRPECQPESATHFSTKFLSEHKYLRAFFIASHQGYGGWRLAAPLNANEGKRREGGAFRDEPRATVRAGAENEGRAPGSLRPSSVWVSVILLRDSTGADKKIKTPLPHSCRFCFHFSTISFSFQHTKKSYFQTNR